MTMAAKKQLFPELKLASLNQEATRNNLLKHEKIVAKQLFYDHIPHFRWRTWPSFWMRDITRRFANA